MKAKIVAIGEADIILPFKAIGAEIHPVTGSEDAKKVLQQLMKEEIGLILIPEELGPELQDFLLEARGRPLPCILPIPCGQGSTGFALKEMRELIKKAVGVDMIT